MRKADDIMEGSVTKRKDGRWQGVIDVPNLTNKRIRKYVYASTRAECRRKINELIEQIEGDGLLNPSKVTFNELAEKWLNTYCINLSPTTLYGYKKNIKTNAKRYIGDALLFKILPDHIQTMINDFSKSHSEKSCRNLLSDVSGVFKYAVLNKIIKNNPCNGVKVPLDSEKYQYYIYDEDEFNALLDVVTGTSFEIPVLLGALCGLRLSEIMGLTWNDIDFETKQINVRKANVCINSHVITKTTKTRTSYRKITAPSYVIERLLIYKGVGYVYPKNDGSAENGGSFSKRFSRMLKRNSLPHTRFHDLRHFNATMMLKKGVSDKEASERLGHSDVNMTKKYQHVLSNMKSKSADILDSIVHRSDVKKDVK